MRMAIYSFYLFSTIIVQVAKNFTDQPSLQYVNAPLLTEKEKKFFTLLLSLEMEKYPEMANVCLFRIEQYILYRGCSVKNALPLVRLYLAICRLRGDITRVRKFMCDAFYLINDNAVPVCFTILKNWVDVMPMWDKWQSKYCCNNARG